MDQPRGGDGCRERVRTGHVGQDVRRGPCGHPHHGPPGHGASCGNPRFQLDTAPGLLRRGRGAARADGERDRPVVPGAVTPPPNPFHHPEPGFHLRANPVILHLIPVPAQ